MNLVEVVESGKSVQEIVNIFPGVCARHHFGVLGSIDLRQKLLDKGIPFQQECVIMEVCNPLQAQRVLESNIAISTALPCRISIYSEDGKTKIATIKATAMLGMFSNLELQPVAHEVEQVISQIMHDLA